MFDPIRVTIPEQISLLLCHHHLGFILSRPAPSARPSGTGWHRYNPPPKFRPPLSPPHAKLRGFRKKGTDPSCGSSFRLAPPAAALAGKALVGRSILYRWPVQGWAQGRVVRVRRAARMGCAKPSARWRRPLCWTPLPSRTALGRRVGGCCSALPSAALALV